MGISRAAGGLALLAVLGAGCGGSGRSASAGPSGSSTATTAATSHASGSSGAAEFSWLRPQAAPAGWRTTRIPSGAVLAYPPSWTLIKSDPGTATAALRAPGGAYLGYLNITPQQGEETLADWRTFRVHHNHEEGDRRVVRLAYADGLAFLDGHGNCVKDAYISGTGVHYIEIACLVAGSRTSTVVVGAAPPSAWSQVAGSLRRAISGFRT